MKPLLVVLGLFAAAVVVLLTELAKEMFVAETQTRLERLPLAILRIARRRAAPEIRTWLYEEVWLADLEFITRETEGLPITRLLRATRFALGLLRSASAMSRATEADAALIWPQLTYPQIDAIAAVRATLADQSDVSVLGVCGPWGSGKSTVMLTLQNPEPCLDARYSQHVVVPFNAWSTPSFNDFAADLTDAIRSAIAVHLADHRLGSGWFRARSAWVGHKLRMPNRHRRWEPPPDRELSIALDRLWRQGRSAVVFVDDIDRCDPRTVGVVLETVRTLVHQFPDGRVRFVLAFDADLLASYLDASTADTDAGRSGERGRAMLEKLISVQLRLPVRLRRLPGEDVPPAKG